MNKTVPAIFFLIISLSICIIIPFTLKKSRLEYMQQVQHKYEADYLVWEIQTYKKIDASVLPDSDIEFYCYDSSMELVNILYGQEELDFSEYHCVIFEHQGIKRGVCIE